MPLKAHVFTLQPHGSFLFFAYHKTYFYVSECSIDSEILTEHESLRGHFHRFFAPAVGNKCQWSLCFRATSGFRFHNGCDGYNNTVVIIKVDSYVFGGYTDIPWGEIVILNSSPPVSPLFLPFSRTLIFSIAITAAC